MSAAWRVFGAALRDTWRELWFTFVADLFWLLCQLLILPGPPATLALFYCAHQLAQGEVISLGDFWWALRHYWKVAWRWGLINGAMLFVLIGDLVITGQPGRSPWLGVAQGFFWAALFGWLLFQLFSISFLFEQESPSVRLALRNGAVLLGSNIGFAVTLGLLLAIFFLLGTLLFMLSMATGGMMVALVGSHAVRDRLAVQRQKEPL